MITAFYTGILAFLQIALTLQVVRRRWKYRVGFGDGGEGDLLRHIRIHGNFTETVPLSLLILLLLELGGAPVWVVHALGVGVVSGRLAHIYGMIRGKGVGIWRRVGMVITLSVFLAGGCFCLYLGWPF